jgi:transposase-like protein
MLARGPGSRPRERAELTRLRRENRSLRMEQDLLNMPAFFARERVRVSTHVHRCGEGGGARADNCST